MLDLAFERKTQLADATDDFQPRKHEPKSHTKSSGRVAVGQEIAAQVGGSQVSQPAELLYEAIVKSTARHRKHNGCGEVEKLLEVHFKQDTPARGRVHRIEYKPQP